MPRLLAVVLPAGLLLALSLLEPTSEGRPAAPQLSPPGAEVAELVRRGEFDAARARLAPSGEVGRSAPESGLMLGLVAAASDRPETALELLAQAPASGRFADWRLLATADSYAALGRAAEALRALGELDPASPLRAAAAVRAVEIALAHGEPAQAYQLATGKEVAGLPRDTRRRLAELAWDAAEALPDPGPRRSSAANLLAEFPIEASQRKVIETFRQPDGGLDWPSFMTTDQLLTRARQLMDANVDKSALDTLEQVPGTARGTAWELLYAEALVENHRGLEALERLSALSLDSQLQRARREWLQATAALDAATVRRGRRNLPPEERQAMRDQAAAHLHQVAALPEHPGLAAAALRTLLTRAEAGESLEQSMPLVRALRTLEPADFSGIGHLWRLGWEAFDAGRPSDALRAWQELLDLEEPWTGYGRAALYWSGRAQLAVGDTERARETLGRVAEAPYQDFYRRYALRALDRGEPPPDDPPSAERQEWPRDSRLERAQQLFDFGLDEMALVEIEALAAEVEPRARYALESQVLASQGRRRESIHKLRGAFRELGSVRQDRVPEEALRMYYPLDFAPLVETHARGRELSPHLVLAMIRQESAFDARAVSGAGARGLMQLMPATGRELARQLGLRYPGDGLVDPEFSVQLGTAYLGKMMEMFGDNELLALAGYNAGPYRIRRLWRRAGGEPEMDHFLEGLPLRETRIYVKRVLLFADSYRQLYG